MCIGYYSDLIFFGESEEVVDYVWQNHFRIIRGGSILCRRTEVHWLLLLKVCCKPDVSWDEIQISVQISPWHLIRMWPVSFLREYYHIYIVPQFIHNTALFSTWVIGRNSTEHSDVSGMETWVSGDHHGVVNQLGCRHGWILNIQKAFAVFQSACFV